MKAAKARQLVGWKKKRAETRAKLIRISSEQVIESLTLPLTPSAVSLRLFGQAAAEEAIAADRERIDALDEGDEKVTAPHSSSNASQCVTP